MDKTTETMITPRDMLAAGCAMSGPWLPTADDGRRRVPYVVVPEDYEVKDLEHLLPFPTRKRAEVSVTTTDSFIIYAKKHGSLDECVIYAEIAAEQSKCVLLAVMNDNGATAPKWRDHRCKFEPALSVEWKRWLSKNGPGKAMSQTDFATWLEDNQGDVRSVNGSPSGADILAMAQAFEVNADKRVKSHVNLQSGGVRFEFIEDETKDTRTSMEVFRRFTLALPVFDGSTDAYPVEARLKYRDNNGKVTFWYELIRPDRAFKTAVNEALNQIKEATGFMLLQGTP